MIKMMMMMMMMMLIVVMKELLPATKWPRGVAQPSQSSPPCLGGRLRRDQCTFRGVHIQCHSPTKVADCVETSAHFEEYVHTYSVCHTLSFPAKAADCEQTSVYCEECTYTWCLYTARWQINCVEITLWVEYIASCAHTYWTMNILGSNNRTHCHLHHKMVYPIKTSTHCELCTCFKHIAYCILMKAKVSDCIVGLPAETSVYLVNRPIMYLMQIWVYFADSHAHCSVLV